jgi:diaminohydroxyphosphoribosylaminopyrimidine deaminase / 5-amino-6-(5-phosphoribosylamino)uracil reductase
MLTRFGNAAAVMSRALELAARGIGSVEPNPPVGAVLVDDSLNLIAEGWHQRFGGPHAEIEAITQAGQSARGSTLFVTLEPCCHHGKTGPCSDAIAKAGIKRVVVALGDPFPEVDGKGIERLRSLGVDVELGLHSKEAAHLVAPFIKLVTMGQPWVHAKWAMSLDGKIATHTGDSRWISSDASRTIVHRLRGRMDAILVGVGTALRDDPLLTARPAGPRVATRIVVDSAARIPLDSQLVQTARDVPLLIATTPAAPPDNIRHLEKSGVEVAFFPSQLESTLPHVAGTIDLKNLLDELGRRRFTNVLVEGGSRLFGSLYDGDFVDESHVFVAPKILGGAHAPSAVAGLGSSSVDAVAALESVVVEKVSDDVYINARRRFLFGQAPAT